jgi:hypothetical protein
MEFTDPATMLALTALRRLREGQAAVGDSPLWGRNLEESRRLYTRACLIVDSACKHVSGDIFESIYSLRHGVISDEELDALTIDDPRLAQIAQRRVSARANHRQVATTVEHYFHLGPEVAHRRARRAVGSLLTPSITAKWSGLSVDALHQRLSRSGLDRTEVLWSAIADAARLSELKSIEVEFPCAPSLAALAKARLTIDDVACSNVCTALRFEDRRRIRDFDELGVTAATPWTRALIEARTRYADQYEDALHPAAMRQPKLRPVARRLRRHCDSASTRKVTQLWRACARRGVLDVSDPIHLHAWLTFLMDCGVPPSRLVLRVEPNMTAKVAVLNAVFSKVTGLVPTIDEVPAGKGRHPAYLLISSQDPVPGQTLPPAATSMAGFNALMVAACIREDLLGDTESGGRDGAA